MNDDIVIGKRGHRIVIPKKHANEFADLIIAVRNNPQDNINPFMAFLRDQVSTALEDDIYEDVYDRLVQDNKDITEILRRTGNIAKGAGASILSMCSKFYLPIPIGPDWTDRFYKVLQLNTWLIYVISEMHSENQEISAAIRKCASIKNDPVYNWVFAGASKMVTDTSQNGQQTKQVKSFTSDEILNLDSRDYSIVAQSVNQWQWAFTPIPGERPKTLIQMLGANTFSALKGDISATFTSFTAGAVNGAMGISEKFANIGKDVDRMGKEVSTLRKIASELGTDYPGGSKLPEVPNKLNGILRKDFIKKEKMWLRTFLDIGLTFEMVIDCYEEVKEYLAEQDVVFANKKQDYEENHQEEVDSKKAEEEEIAKESDADVKQMEEEGLDPMAEFEKAQQDLANSDTAGSQNTENTADKGNSDNEPMNTDDGVVGDMSALNNMTRKAVKNEDNVGDVDLNINDSSNEVEPADESTRMTTSENNTKQDNPAPEQPKNSEPEYSREKALELTAKAIEALNTAEKTNVVNLLFLNLGSIRRSIGFNTRISDVEIKSICEISMIVINKADKLNSINAVELFKSQEQIEVIKKYGDKDFIKLIDNSSNASKHQTQSMQSSTQKPMSALDRMSQMNSQPNQQPTGNNTESQIAGDLRNHYNLVASCVNFINSNGINMEIPRFQRQSWEIHFAQIQPELRGALKAIESKGITIPSNFAKFM